MAGTGAGNLIWGSSYAGIDLYEETTTDTIVGNAILANATGVYLLADANVQIGGTNVQDGNLISGDGTGVNVDGGAKNLIQGNLIGTDITGTWPRIPMAPASSSTQARPATRSAEQRPGPAT